MNEIRTKLDSSLRLIKSDEIRAWVNAMLDIAPQAFWVRPCSSTGKHHRPDENAVGGQVVHTARVCNVAMHLSNMLSLTEWEQDILLASAILHDTCKYGLDGKSTYTNENHPQLLEILRDNNCIFLPECSSYKEILLNVAQHMGRWTVEPIPPATKLGKLLHIADFIASRNNIEVQI
jgi:HD superfamily phosphohydrolase YqeK